MSAESPRRLSRTSGQIVRPQHVSDKSVMESVVDFIHDVVPQAYSSSVKNDEKDTVLWVRFAYSDINDLNTFPDGSEHNGNTPPLLIILGYSNGIQIWIVPANGEAQEVLLWRQGIIKSLCVLPTPQSVFHGQDMFSQRRPLIAFCDGSSAGQQFCSVNFVSLKTGDQVHSIKFKNPVCNIYANKRVIVVTFQERIAVFDACTFKDRFSITGCYPCPGPNPNSIALGTRWLAYADSKLVSVHQTCGGMAGEGVQSYTATVIHAAKTISKGLSMFGETVASSLTGTKSHPMPTKKELSADDPHPGIVTIVDVQNVGDEEVNVHEDNKCDGIIAHFVAHANEPITAMQFDMSGVLLLTADKLGHNFHLFRILPHPASSSLGAVHHLYTLYRGDTTAKVQDIAFSLDSRWVAVSTFRGTTHIFPITPYGGPVSVRTHTSPKVVNRLSRFHKSAGLEEIPAVSTGRNSPSLSGSPGSSSSQTLKSYDSHPSIPYHNTTCGRMGNPRLPPYPLPTHVNPLAQLRQPLPFGSIATGVTKSPPSTKGRRSISTNGSENVNMVAIFAPPRAWLAGSPSVSREKGDKRPVGALYVISSSGNLIEYLLEPKPASGIPKVSDDSPIELEVQARAQWTLLSKVSTCVEVKPPLPSTNPLMMAQEIALNAQKDREHGFSGNSRLSRLHRGPGTPINSDLELEDESWLSQVEIITHAGPPRRLWMGPQFSFKTFQQPANTTILSSSSSALLSQSPELASSPSAMDIFTEELNLESLGVHPMRSNPVAMPSGRQPIPLLIEAGSGSFEQPPELLEVCGSWPDSGSCESGSGRTSEQMEDQLKENLADAMIESPVKESGTHQMCQAGSTVDVQGSMEELSSSSSHSGSVSYAYDARASPPHSMEHVLVFPTDNGSPSSS